MKKNMSIIGYERGLASTQLPVWTDNGSVITFSTPPENAVSRSEIEQVPGAFQLFNVLSSSEADAFVERTEQLGFHQDSPVSLPHSIRHNDNLNWVVSKTIDDTIWQRCKALVTENIDNQIARGLNPRFRFYRYSEGDFFQTHTDASWTGSRVINGQLIADAYPGWYSKFTFLLFLNDAYAGGHTQFLVTKSEPKKPAISADNSTMISVKTPKGAALCFPHGDHPLHCLHAGEEVSSGIKTLIRTEILFG
jgi:hypothetical protein